MSECAVTIDAPHHPSRQSSLQQQHCRQQQWIDSQGWWDGKGVEGGEMNEIGSEIIIYRPCLTHAHPHHFAINNFTTSAVRSQAASGVGMNE